MCLLTNNKEIHIAKENILVYKVITIWNTSEYEGFLYLRSKEYKTKIKMLLRDPFRYESQDYLVNDGFHSFIEKQDAIHMHKGRVKYKVNCFVIPKGSEYILGSWGYHSVTNIVSNRIIRIGGRFFTWLWKLKNKAVLFEEYDPQEFIKLQDYVNRV